EARADLDVGLGEQAFSDRRLVDPCGDHDSIQRPEPLVGRRQKTKSDRLEPCGEREVLVAMALPARLEAFLADGDERFTQRVDQRRGDRVVVLAAYPVVLEQPDVEIEGA